MADSLEHCFLAIGARERRSGRHDNLAQRKRSEKSLKHYTTADAILCCCSTKTHRLDMSDACTVPVGKKRRYLCEQEYNRDVVDFFVENMKDFSVTVDHRIVMIEGSSR
jgi:hypothetical protein